jgi:GT2 family glycosyltransferase
VSGEAPDSSNVSGVTAVVLTHRRPRLAGSVVRSLLSQEGFEPAQIVVVVNGSGGLDDPALEAAVRMVRLRRNTGPAGGFRAGLLAAFENPDVRWAYLCEDDVGLFDLPTPRVARLIGLLESDPAQESTGAVVGYGRRFVGRGHSVNVVPDQGDPALVPVDVACWGATLVSRRVVERGVLPDEAWFFGVEDFDFFCRLRAAGFGVMADTESARVAAEVQTNSGRDRALSAERPVDADEPWRAYYVARNFFHLARAHGTASWLAWHLVYSARRMQLASSAAERRATLHGLLDGLRRRYGPHPRYLRDTGEYAPAPD